MRTTYLITENVNAAISTGANLLWTSPYSLSGSGVTIGLWDGGSARPTHQEFGGRVTVKDGAATIDHATHVGGTLIAEGLVASARGMANAALVDSYDWNSDTSEMTARGATAPGVQGPPLRHAGGGRRARVVAGDLRARHGPAGRARSARPGWRRSRNPIPPVADQRRAVPGGRRHRRRAAHGGAEAPAGAGVDAGLRRRALSHRDALRHHATRRAACRTWAPIAWR